MEPITKAYLIMSLLILMLLGYFGIFIYPEKAVSFFEKLPQAGKKTLKILKEPWTLFAVGIFAILLISFIIIKKIAGRALRPEVE